MTNPGTASRALTLTAVLFFLPTFATSRPVVPADGWAAPGEPFHLSATLAGAEATAVAPDGQTGRVLVLDGNRLTLSHLDPPQAHLVPRDAVLNVDPDGDFWAPRPIDAGGGYVVRPSLAGAGDRLDVLMIFRRGAWDLPKGKLDPGEAFENAAVREVSEEVGIPLGSLRLAGSVGGTVHGYFWPKKDLYAVKTTRWFAMTTTAEAFEPETREGIEAVAWVGWAEAGRRLGFESLRAHHAGLSEDAVERMCA